MPKMSKQQIILIIDGLMDEKTRAGTIKLIAPSVGESVSEILAGVLDTGVEYARKEAATQLGEIFKGNPSGNPVDHVKDAAQGMVKATLKGVVFGLVDSFFPDE